MKRNGGNQSKSRSDKNKVIVETIRLGGAKKDKLYISEEVFVPRGYGQQFLMQISKNIFRITILLLCNKKYFLFCIYLYEPLHLVFENIIL